MQPLPEIYRQHGFRFDFGHQDTVTVEQAAIFWAHERASVKTPFAGTEIYLELLAHTGEPITVKAVNGQGEVLGVFNDPPPYPRPLTMTFEAPAGDLVRLKLAGGGNESGIAKVCVTRD